MAESRLQVVGEETADEPFQTQKAPIGQKFAGDAIALALTALSQKSLVALSSLFTLSTVASAFVLWYVTPDPNTFQLIKLGLYGIFVLGANWIVRRR